MQIGLECKYKDDRDKGSICRRTCLAEADSKLWEGATAGELERVDKVVLLLLYRIYSNLYSALLLTVQALKKGRISFFSYRLESSCDVALLIACSLYLFREWTRNRHTRNLI